MSSLSPSDDSCSLLCCSLGTGTFPQESLSLHYQMALAYLFLELGAGKTIFNDVIVIDMML